MPELTDLHKAQAEIANADLWETVKRWEAEGIHPRAALAALTSTLVTVVATTIAPDEVPVWFARLSAQTMHLANKG